jgi:hypothetical protein
MKFTFVQIAILLKFADADKFAFDLIKEDLFILEGKSKSVNEYQAKLLQNEKDFVSFIYILW